VFANQIRDLKPTGPDQIWVAKLTDLRTTDGFVFLALVMDAWSRKIVGRHVSNSLKSFGCQEALDEALKGLSAGGGKPIHHSDRGCQYCCHAYVQKLQENGLGISMTEEMHCYENGKAERVIGTLKWEYGLDGMRPTKVEWIRAVDAAIRAYNEQRPHNGIQGRIPAQMHATG
jgi:transposase InsO family protein